MVHRKLNWCLFSTKLPNVTRSGVSGSACWDTLVQGLHEPCTICPRQRARRRLSSMCDLSGARRTFSLLCMHAYNPPHAARWLPALSVPDSIRFLPISLHAYFMAPIKNAPRWLVKGRWEWRLGLFKDLSQLFRAKFDSENGGGLISHAEVFRGVRVPNGMHSALMKVAQASTKSEMFVVN